MRILFFILLLFANNFLYSQAPRVEKKLQWSQKGYYILNPAIAHTKNEITFARQPSASDSLVNTNSITGNEIADSYISKENNDLRLYDPIISLLDVNSKKISLIDYGWSPTFSINDNRIAYAYQVHPLEKYDKLFAEAYNGNSIKVFNKITKNTDEVAKPLNNFLLDPFFTDSTNLLYKTGNKVNGPYGGGISFSYVNIETKKTTLVKQPAIKFRLNELMGEPYLIDKKLAYTIYSPADSGSGMANEYLHLLLSENGKDTLQNFGIRKFTNLNYKFAVNSKNEILFLEDELFMPEDTSFISIYNNNKLLNKKPLNFKYKTAYLSPGGAYLLYITTDLDAYIVNTNNLMQTKIDVAKKEFHAVVWSADGQKLVLVQDHATEIGTDELFLFHLK